MTAQSADPQPPHDAKPRRLGPSVWPPAIALAGWTLFLVWQAFRR